MSFCSICVLGLDPPRQPRQCAAMRQTPPPRVQAVVFDFDGTLATLTIDFELMRRKVAAVAQAFLDGRFFDHGQPILEWMDDLAKAVEETDGLDLAREFHTRCRFVVMDMEIKAAEHGKLFAYTRPMLEELRSRNMATGIITRNCFPAVTAVFPDVELEIGVLLSRESVARVKPNPGHLRAAMDKLGVEPQACLMVGDHPLDVETGKRAGVRTAAVASGRTSLEVLAEAEPDFLLPDCSGLLAELERRNLLPRAWKRVRQK